MKPKNHTLLLHPFFLLGLFLLLLNDFYLKYEFHNSFTGKLSDFTGLFIFYVFIAAFFHSYKKTILILLTLFFVWWKSPLSSPFIFFINSVLHIPLYRVVDYSDYTALAILPLAYYLNPVHYSPSLSRQIAMGCICIVSFFAFTATSLPRRMTNDNKVVLNKYIRTKKNESQIIDALENHGMKPRKDSAFDELDWGAPYYLKSRDSSGKVIYFPQDSLYEGVYRKKYGSVYAIPEMHVGLDTIYNLQFIITYSSQRKTDIELYTFEFKNTQSPPNYSTGFYIWKRLRKPIKKKFKEMVD